MALFRKHIDFLRLIAIFAGSTYLCACATWRLQTVEPAARPAAFDSTKTYRVLLTNGKRQVVPHPAVSGDSVVWAEGLSDAEWAPPKRRGILLSEIREVEVPSTNPAAVALVVVTGIILLGAGLCPQACFR